MFAKKRLWWISSMILQVILGWFMIPSSQDVAQKIADEILFSIILVPLLIISRFFTRVYQRKGINILRDYWNQK
jgi:hypothetical protein